MGMTCSDRFNGDCVRCLLVVPRSRLLSRLFFENCQAEELSGGTLDCQAEELVEKLNLFRTSTRQRILLFVPRSSLLSRLFFDTLNYLTIAVPYISHRYEMGGAAVTPRRSSSRLSKRRPSSSPSTVMASTPNSPIGVS